MLLFKKKLIPTFLLLICDKYLKIHFFLISELLYMFAAPVYLFVKSDIPGLSNFPSSTLDEMIRYVVVSNLKWLFEFFWECFSIR